MERSYSNSANTEPKSARTRCRGVETRASVTLHVEVPTRTQHDARHEELVREWLVAPLGSGDKLMSPLQTALILGKRKWKI